MIPQQQQQQQYQQSALVDVDVDVGMLMDMDPHQQQQQEQQLVMQTRDLTLLTPSPLSGSRAGTPLGSSPFLAPFAVERGGDVTPHHYLEQGSRETDHRHYYCCRLESVKRVDIDVNGSCV
ncbi:hypothetical protein UCREL1_3386 [Eutypa lata UCREL1]|uniref:Uncharacterized protein n=1 Tax=Eutypa lata (strain UCR-EL1) TaxID=1287681 RepID=M7TI17_EUTLA|nr:hypothetical protein UCREL1_3386 [Eutypa lata UCREL1]